MRPVSQAFLRSLRGSHRMVAEARVVAAGQTGVDPVGTTIPILSGDVQIDGTADVRSTLDMTTEGAGMWPTGGSSLLAPYGNEIWVRRGIQYGNGTIEWVSLGYHRIQTPEQETVPNGPIRITCQDRMAGIIKAKLLAPVQYAATATYGAVVAALVGDVYPWATIEWDDPAVSGQTLNRAVIAESDRHELLNDLITSLGRIWYWDHRGVLVIKTPPSPTTPVWDVTHGASGVLVAMSRRLTSDGVYNGVVAKGEGADTSTPVRAVAVDNNPASPTYWYGPFGKAVEFYSSPFIVTASQAATAAQAILLRQLGLPYSIDFTAVPNPALEPYDPVRVRYCDTRAAEVHVLERLTIPLDASAPLTASTREQTLISIGSL